MTTSSGKHLEDISPAYIVSLMYKLIRSAKDSDDLSNGFDRSRDRKTQELTNKKTRKGKYHVRNMPKDVLGFAANQEKATSGLGFNFTLTRNKDEAVIDKTTGIADARNKIDLIH